MKNKMLKYFLISKYLRKRTLMLLSAGGMAVTVMVFIVVFSVLDGFGLGVSERLRGTKADIVIQDISGRHLADYEAVMSEIESEVPAAEACAPYIERYAMFEYLVMHYRYKPRTDSLEIAGRPQISPQPQYGIIRGIDPEREAEVGKLTRFLEDGGFFDINPDATLADILVPGSNNVIVGARFRLSSDFGVGPHESKHCIIGGKHLPLDTFPGKSDLEKIRAATKHDPAPGLLYFRLQISSIKTGEPDFKAQDGFTIKGRFRTGDNVFDERVILMHYKDAQKLLGMDRQTSLYDFIPTQPATVSGINVKLKPDTDERKLSAIKARIETILQRHNAKCTVRGWREIDEKVLEALAVEKAVTIIILTCIFVAMGAGVFVIQWFSVVRHTRDIGILKSIGVNNRGIMSIFFGLSLTIGVVGALLGLMLGIIVAANVNDILFFIEKTTGWSLFPRDVYSYERIPTVIDLNMYLIIAGGAVLICALAGLLPAMSAARRDPAKCLVVE